MNLISSRAKTIISKPKFTTGFTLVELLVTISIFAILTGIVLFNQGKFNSTILLTNLAYDTALTIRQAQSYGINVKEFNNNTDIYYGVHFDMNYPKSFILFADLNKNAEYDGGTTADTCDSNTECLNRYVIKRGNYIFKIELYQGSGSYQTISNGYSFDIIFKRPNPDAVMKYSGNDIVKTFIYLKSSDGNIRKVEVYKNGLIQVK